MRGFSLVLLLVISQESLCQYKDYFEKNLQPYKNFVFAKEQDFGRFLSLRSLKKKEINEYDGKGEFSMFLGSPTYLHDFLKNEYEDFEAIVIKTKSQWQIRFAFNETYIDLFKRLQLKGQWTDKFAYQKPENYWVAYGFDINDKRLSKALGRLFYYYKESNINYESNVDKNEIQLFDDNVTKSGEDFATLYFYNLPPYFNSRAYGKYDVKLNDSIVYKFKKDTPSIVKIYKEGNYKITAKSDKSLINIFVEKGKQYYIRCGVHKSSFNGKPKLHSVVKEYGEEEYLSCLKRYNSKQERKKK